MLCDSSSIVLISGNIVFYWFVCFLCLDIYRHHINVFSLSLSLSLISCRLNRASLLIKAPSSPIHREEETRRSCGQMDHVAAAAASSALFWSLTSRIHSDGRSHSNTDTWPQRDTWRWLKDTEAGLPVHLLLTTILSLSFCVMDHFHWFCYELWTSSGHFRNLLNNWKSEKAVTWKPYLRMSQVMTYKNNIYW